MSGHSPTIASQPAAQHLLGTSAEYMRAEQSRVGGWLAVMWHRVLFGILILEIPLQIDAYLFHDASQAEFGAISGFNISLTSVCLLLLYVQWLPRLVVESAKIQLSKSLIAYMAFAAASIVWANNRSLALYELFLLLQAFLLFFYVVNTVKTRPEILFVVKLLLIGVAVQGLMMLVTKYVGDDIEFGPLSFQYFTKSGRVTGSLASPNVAASYLALILAPSFCVLFMPVSKLLRLLALVALILGSAGLILTMSRGGWVAAAFSLGFCCLFAYHKRWISGGVMILLAFGFVILMLPFQEALLDRIFGEDHGSAESRFPLYHLSALLIADHPAGVGANNWDAVAQSYATTSQFREEWYYTVHNKYLLVWAEISLFGLLAFLVFLSSTVRTGYQSLFQNDKFLAPLALGFSAAIVGQMIHMNFDVFNSRPQIQGLWLVAALVIAIRNVSLESIEEVPAPN